jgi:hypothetical protein
VTSKTRERAEACGRATRHGGQRSSGRAERGKDAPHARQRKSEVMAWYLGGRGGKEMARASRSYAVPDRAVKEKNSAG